MPVPEYTIFCKFPLSFLFQEKESKIIYLASSLHQTFGFKDTTSCSYPNTVGGVDKS